MNIILTDPRGTGCNNVVSDPIPRAFFSTDNIAADVFAIIEQRQMHNYLMFGWSYGTQLASVIGARAELAGFAPLGVVLQSPIGKHFGDDFNVYAGFQREWGKTWADLSPPIKDLLSTEPLPFKLSAAQWGAFIVGKTMFPGKKTFANALSVLDGGTQTQLDALKTAVETWATNIMTTDPIYQRMYQAIACDEIASSDNTDVSLVNGDLIGYQNPSICYGRPMNHPFDSKHYQISSPVFYLQGLQDPATIVENAKYHFDNQSHGKKFFITVPLMGHRPIDRLSDCFSELWKSFENSGDSIQENIAKCSAQPMLEMK